MSDKLKEEYKNLKELGEKAGIVELMKVYGQFEEYLKISEQYLEEFNPKFSFSTSNSTYMVEK